MRGRHWLLLAIFVAGCGGNKDSCVAATACMSDATKSTRLCSGAADDCYYQTSDGQRFHCVTCGDCAEAQAMAAAFCGDESALIGTNCSAAVQCTGGVRTGSYQACTTPTGSACGFKTSNGVVFACNSCSDCVDAAQKATDWCATSCDLVAQDCGTGKKCMPGLSTNAGAFITGCQADGTASLDDTCTSTVDASGYNSDGCKAGLLCGIRRQCGQMCCSDSDCGDGKCILAVSDGQKAVGECVTTCAPFTGGGCASGSDCSGNYTDIDSLSASANATAVDGYFYCRTDGAMPKGASCNGDLDCAAGLECIASSDGTTASCQPDCDNRHACPIGYQCTPYANLGGAGWCAPTS
jgi:hypothetical protein